MGRDKARLEIQGVTLAGRTVAALREAGAVAVTGIGGDPEALADIDFDHHRDRYPGQGPLGGVLTALGAATTEIVVVLACDLPQVAASAISRVVDALEPEADASVPVTDGYRQVLHAAWRRSALPGLEADWAAGQRAVHHALDGLRVTWVDDIDPQRLRDVDTPDEWRATPGHLEDGQ